MNNFNEQQVLRDMLNASQIKAGAVWNQAKDDIKEEFKVLVNVGGRIVARKGEGTITEVNARFLIAQYYGAMRSYLYSLEGIANLILESIINAALGVLRDAIKVATNGWILI